MRPGMRADTPYIACPRYSDHSGDDASAWANRARQHQHQGLFIILGKRMKCLSLPANVPVTHRDTLRRAITPEEEAHTPSRKPPPTLSYSQQIVEPSLTRQAWPSTRPNDGNRIQYLPLVQLTEVNL